MHTDHMNLDAPARKALRFLTAGSVDDGKSTFIGRLLLDSRALLSDQIEAVQGDAGELALADLTDGLESEREQGITIDVAYRYFATPQRKFIIADTPGHEQYTRNMVTAAAGSDAAVVLVDATKLDWQADAVHLLPQTRRHALLAKLLRLPSLVFAVNKLDAVDDPAAAFARIDAALWEFAAAAELPLAAVLPLSALRGDNVAVRSEKWPWWTGPSLLEVLEDLPNAEDGEQDGLLLPVQYVSIDGGGTGHQRRVAWGRVARGTVRVGDRLQLLSSGEQAEVVELRHHNGDVASAGAGTSVGVVFDRQVDISRGDWLSPAEAPAATAQDFTATVAWLDVESAVVGRKYWLRHGHGWVAGRIAAIDGQLDIQTLRWQASDRLTANEIGRVRLQTQSRLPLVPWAENRAAGAMILVDPASHRTSGAVLLEAGR